jgi:hypothetical protein
MPEPALTILARFGGAGPLSRLLGLDRSAVHRWALPKARGGSGGLVPAKHHLRLLALGVPQSHHWRGVRRAGGVAGISPRPAQVKTK